MAHLKFEGHIKDVSARQLEYIASVLEDRDYKNVKVVFKAVGEAGDNYVANVKRIIVEKDGEIFKMIAKIAPANETLRMMMNTAAMFNNEHIMYTEVLPKYSELEKSAGVPKDDRLRYAACYGTSTEAPNEVILLEDLQISNFVMLDRFKSLTDEQIKLVLKNFAIIHSLSYALKKEEPETYMDYKSKLFNMFEHSEKLEEFSTYLILLEDEVGVLLDGRYRNKVKGKLAPMTTYGRKMLNIDNGSKYSVIQQGDSWTNNIMFRLEDGNAVDCCMIDYQLSKESSPVADLQYMIFNCTDYGTRAKYYYDWIDYYHSELDKSLANFGLKANYVYPRDQLDIDLRRYGKFSFANAVMLATILIRQAGDAAKLKEAMTNGDMDNMTNVGKVSNLDKESIAKFKNKVEGLVDSFEDFGYF